MRSGTVTAGDFTRLDFDKRLIHPFTMIVTGITGSGKTEFVKRLLERQKKCIDVPIHKVYYHYSIFQPAYARMRKTVPNIEFHKGIPSRWERLNENETFKKDYVIVIDDLMAKALDDPTTASLYMAGSHHENISVITLTQNMFPRQKEARTVSINSQYLVLFKNPRDKSQIKTLATQITDGKGERRHFIDSYVAATKKPYTYLFADFKPTTPEELKYRDGITERYDHGAYLPIDYPLKPSPFP
jgi:hypothetical protein